MGKPQAMADARPGLFSIKNLQTLSSREGLLKTFGLVALSALIVVFCFILQSYIENVLQSRSYFIWYPVVYIISAFWGMIPGSAALLMSLVAAVLTISSEGIIHIQSPIEILPLGCLALMSTLFVFGNQRKHLISRQLAFELLEKEKTQSRLEQLGMITEGANDLILLCDSDGRILYLNRRARQSLGIENEKNQSTVLFLWEVFEPILDSETKLFRAAPRDLIQHKVVSGTLRPKNHVRLIPVRLSQLEVPGTTKQEKIFAFIFYDQSLEIELNLRVRIAKGHLPMGLWSYDFSSNFYDASVEHDQVLGIKAEKWSLERLLECVDSLDAEMVASWIEGLKSSEAGSDFDLIFRVRTEEDELRWVHSVGIVFRDSSGKVVRIEGVLLNITTIKKSEEKFREAVELRDHFFAIASHELKTPIASLNLQIEVLRQSIQAALKDHPAVQIDCLEVIDECEQQYKRLTNLINDFLDVARITNGKLLLSRSTFSIREWIESTTKLFSTNSLIKVIAEESVFKLDLEADQERLRQVLVNLISNAVKFGLNRPIEVSFGGNDAEIWIKVKDHGIGIEKKDIRRIFNEFEQSTLGLQKRGLGLGLYITREIVHAHGGQIHVESRLKEGSTFEIVLPRRFQTHLLEKESKQIANLS
ncbi:MAG: Sensory box histidine kinase [Bacteriovoracaceae bacterium]|nr:Sensory box histidine kinase [Bacteriovoracaceae bacterium]